MFYNTIRKTIELIKLLIMELSNFRIAEGLRQEIDELKECIEDMDRGRFGKGFEITLTTGFSNAGRDETVTLKFGSKVGIEIGIAVKKIVRDRIAKLEEEFKVL